MSHSRTTPHPALHARKRHLRSLTVTAWSALIVLLAFAPAAMALDIERAELSDSRLRVEVSGVAARAVVTVTSPESSTWSTADSQGQFRVEASPFVSSTCRAIVSDGVSSHDVALSGCTPTAEPTPEPELTSEQEPRIASLTFNPAPVEGGFDTIGTITYTAPIPEGGTFVDTVSNLSQVAQVPGRLQVPAGATSTTFVVTTSQVPVDTLIRIIATAYAVSKSTEFYVLPPPPPPDADTVTITRAEYKDGILRVAATSTRSDATLTVYLTKTGSRIFALTNKGGGKYEGELARLTDPLTITVKSSFGGFDIANTN